MTVTYLSLCNKNYMLPYRVSMFCFADFDVGFVTIQKLEVHCSPNISTPRSIFAYYYK